MSVCTCMFVRVCILYVCVTNCFSTLCLATGLYNSLTNKIRMGTKVRPSYTCTHLVTGLLLHTQLCMKAIFMRESWMNQCLRLHSNLKAAIALETHTSFVWFCSVIGIM